MYTTSTKKKIASRNKVEIINNLNNEKENTDMVNNRIEKLPKVVFDYNYNKTSLFELRSAL